MYCTDDVGAREVAAEIERSRPDILRRPYGFSSPGEGAIADIAHGEGIVQADVTIGDGVEALEMKVPGLHSLSNAVGALIALEAMVPGASQEEIRARVQALREFRGTRRRSEVRGTYAGVTVVDDYAHHPTAIKTTLAGYRDFWPGRRIVVDFMSHTYSRTRALFDDFVTSFGDADIVVLNDIYASAREKSGDENLGGILYEAVSGVHNDAYYEPDFERAARLIERELRAGDLFVTMGAGNNFEVGTRVIKLLRKRKER